MSASTQQVANKPARDASGRLLPGSTANPGGRPRTDAAFAKQAQAFLEADDPDAKRQRCALLLDTLYTEGRAGNIVAIKELLDRAYGKPVQKHDVTIDDVREVGRRVAREMGIDEEMAVAEVEAIYRGER